MLWPFRDLNVTLKLRFLVIMTSVQVEAKDADTGDESSDEETRVETREERLRHFSSKSMSMNVAQVRDIESLVPEKVKPEKQYDKLRYLFELTTIHTISVQGLHQVSTPEDHV